jgi:hypothetical protein
LPLAPPGFDEFTGWSRSKGGPLAAHFFFVVLLGFSFLSLFLGIFGVAPFHRLHDFPAQEKPVSPL